MTSPPQSQNIPVHTSGSRDVRVSGSDSRVIGDGTEPEAVQEHDPVERRNEIIRELIKTLRKAVELAENLV